MNEDRALARWRICQAGSGCTGSALPRWGRCLAHLDADDLDQAIKLAKTEGLDVRGVAVTPSPFERILSLLNWTDQNTPIVPNARFDRATFIGNTWFRKVTFVGNVRFVEATFTEGAWFTETTFIRNAGFAGATFTKGAGFDGASSPGMRSSTRRLSPRARGLTRSACPGNCRSGRCAQPRGCCLLSAPAAQARSTPIDLTRASFAGPAVVAASPGEPAVDE